MWFLGCKRKSRFAQDAQHPLLISKGCSAPTGIPKCIKPKQHRRPPHGRKKSPNMESYEIKGPCESPSPPFQGSFRLGMPPFGCDPFQAGDGGPPFLAAADFALQTRRASYKTCILRGLAAFSALSRMRASASD